MLKVKSLKDAQSCLKEHFPYHTENEIIELSSAVGRVVFEDIKSREFVPDFCRSTVDGYAICARDSFGCSEAIPAILSLKGEVQMGQAAQLSVSSGECIYVPTGGEIPDGADAMVMLEYAEDYGDGTIAIQKPAAPGTCVVFRGDDAVEGQCIFKRGHKLLPKDIGALAAMGCNEISVFRRPRAAIFSTGDEIVLASVKQLSKGQMRDVNGPMLEAAVIEAGAEVYCRKILPDKPELLKAELSAAVEGADLVLISGGSSVGAKDSAEAVLSELGELLFHGLALKPGKPTLAASVKGKPVICLPGHPVAAYFVFLLLAKPLLLQMQDCTVTEHGVPMSCGTSIGSNHGREECVAVSVQGDVAMPIIGKSGLITTLSSADGYIIIPRDTEGLAEGDLVKVIMF